MRLRRALPGRYYPNVLITYATGQRNGEDFEGCGPGMHYARAVAERLNAHGIDCFSGKHAALISTSATQFVMITPTQLTCPRVMYYY